LPINQAPHLTSSLEPATPIAHSQIKIATFNLFNYLEPPNAFYDFERIYSAPQWLKKQNWLKSYLKEYQPDVIGFQEVFSVESLEELVNEQGYQYFQVVDQPKIEGDFIYSKPVVAIASLYPIVEIESVSADSELAVAMGLKNDFKFSRKVLRATVDIPHLGLSDCYVVHFKSKRSMIDVIPDKELSVESNYAEQLKSQIAGGWGSSIQRGSEAALLLVAMLTRREQKSFPMILMGDFNTCLTDGVINHLLTISTSALRSNKKENIDYQYCLKDSWDLYLESTHSDDSIDEKSKVWRTPTHYYGGKGSVLDYILLSCEFDASYQNSLFELESYHTYDRHLINPSFELDGESTDHGIILVTLNLRN